MITSFIRLTLSFALPLIYSLSIVNELLPSVAVDESVSIKKRLKESTFACLVTERLCQGTELQKGGVPATPSGTATLLRLSPNYLFRPRPLLSVTDFRRPRLSWLDGRCVQGPGTYSPRHG